MASTTFIMGEPEGGAATTHLKKENAFLLNTMEMLSEENESILSEVLKCNVCLEIPLNKQVKVCEEGHHFCTTCHKRMEFCGICRGLLLETRNFVVEQLVARLGNIFGISDDVPSEGPTCNFPPGRFKCLHDCQWHMRASYVLEHLRNRHGLNLLDGVRSNPFSGKFSFVYELSLEKDKRFLYSAHVSDMGLFTVELTLSDLDFFGCVRLLGDDAVASTFEHQLVVKIPNGRNRAAIEMSISNCPVFSYSTDTETIRGEGGGLRIKGEDLLEHMRGGSRVGILFSVWRKQKAENKHGEIPAVFCLPERNLFLENDRRTRRNKNRHMRRKKANEKYKSLAAGKKLAEGLSRLTL